MAGKSEKPPRQRRARGLLQILNRIPLSFSSNTSRASFQFLKISTQKKTTSNCLVEPLRGAKKTMSWNHPDMSLDQFMKLIKGFVDILILLSGYQSSGRLAHWDSQNIKKVFQWGLFFENVSIQYHPIHVWFQFYGHL